MRINWILADAYTPDPTVDLEKLKSIGSFWGGWRTWRACQTDNVICDDLSKGSELILREFHKTCNLYLPEKQYVALDRPKGVKLYQGKFEQEVDHADEIITMHLAASQSDILLLLGFDWQPQPKSSDVLTNHRQHVYRNLVKQLIKSNVEVQWVLVDHPRDLWQDLEGLENLSLDTLDNVFTTLST